MARTNLKLFRVKNKLSQEEMSAKIGYTRATYAAIESGRRSGHRAFWEDLQRAFDIPNAAMWELMKTDESA